MCRVGRRCFPHTLSQLEAAEKELARCSLVLAERQAVADRQPVSQAWIDQAADDEATARRAAEQRRIDYASTARGAHNLQIEANAHEKCGQADEARAIRRTIARGLARRRAADTRDRSDGRQWAPPQMRGSGSRCSECGQYVGGNHSCPQVVRDALRRALAAHATGPVSHPGHTTGGTTAAGELSRHMFGAVSLDAGEAAAISAICADNRYGPPPILPALPKRPDGTIDTDSDEFAAHRAAALERAKAACYEDEFIGDTPVPIVLQQGALEPFAAPVKRDVAARLGRQLAGVPDSDLFDDADQAALSAPDNVEWGHTGRSLCWRADATHPWREVGTGERPNITPRTPVSSSDAGRLARRTVASHALSAWAIHTENAPVPGGTDLQAATRDVFVHPSGEGPATLQERRARAIVNAQYATTQRELTDRGIAEVAVSRGMWFPRNQPLPEWVPAEKGERGEAEVPLNAASSFTTRPDVASYFARREWDDDEYVCVRVHGTVPAARVLSTPRTGMGCLAEEEIVVLGGPGRWEVERV
ncbi:hypothetical protein [Prescottella equi]